MGKPSPHKLERRRKRKAKRNRRPHRPVVLAYRGDKYKTDELIPWVYQAEVGIYESFVVTGRRLTDHDVRAAVEGLVVRIRDGMPPIPAEGSASDELIEGPVNLVIWSIRRNWQRLLETLPDPGRDKLVGVLRTLLGSIETWGSRARTPRGYLEFIEEFLAEAGVSVEALSPDAPWLPAPD
ncbi:MAG: hypothetical protein ACYSWU_03365 [Planctomycetota bacterium]